MNLSVLKLKLANEPVWLVQAANAAVAIAVAVTTGGDWRPLVPAFLVALSAPLLRSRVTPVRVAAELVNEALHTPAPGAGPVPVPAAPAAPVTVAEALAPAAASAAAVVESVAKAVEKDLAARVLPSQH
jgi:hypothetical protein